MKNVIFVFAVLTAFAAFCANVPAVAAANVKMLEKTGGLIDKPGKGRVVIVNAQKKIEPTAIARQIEKFNNAVRVKIDIEKGAWKFGDKVPDGAAAALFIVDDPGLPLSLYAPEARWGVLNVAPLEKGARFERALLRSLIATFGAGVSQFKGSPMKTVKGVEDLDKIEGAGITIDALRSILQNLQELGVTQTARTTYLKACQEGWAPPPTNDYQKAIRSRFK